MDHSTLTGRALAAHEKVEAARAIARPGLRSIHLERTEEAQNQVVGYVCKCLDVRIEPLHVNVGFDREGHVVEATFSYDELEFRVHLARDLDGLLTHMNLFVFLGNEAHPVHNLAMLGECLSQFASRPMLPSSPAPESNAFPEGSGF